MTRTDSASNVGQSSAHADNPGLTFVTWTIAILIAFVILFVLSTSLTLSNPLLIGLLAAISALTRAGLAVVVHA